jgi:outer membrane receptor protein involved in Fe transport
MAFSMDAYWNEMTNTLRQTDAGVLNANGNRYYIQAQGEGLLSRGGELSAELRPVDGFELKVGTAYVDASNRSGTHIQGALPQKTPRWSFVGSTRYDVQQGFFKGLGASVGLQWQAERNGGDRTVVNSDPLLLPAYARLDAGLFYAPGGDLDLALNIDNLADALIFVGGTTGASIEAAPPRSVSLRLGYKL